jgi:hypothetical protein
MTRYGVDSLVDTLDGGRIAIDQIRDLTQRAINLIDGFIEARGGAESSTRVLLTRRTNTFCPEVREELLHRYLE